MRFSFDWIGEHVDLAGIDPADAARRLTDCGLTVDTVEAGEQGVAFDVDVTTNRPDAMNHRGLARELAAGLERELRPLPVASAESGPPLPPALVEIRDGDLCPRYAARVIEGVRVGPSPEWLAKRLIGIGHRPINNVVDATNFVLWELGHPLHAFDRDRLAEGRIVVRRSAAGEEIVTLDGERRLLSEGTCVIADAARPVAVAGVMGGLDSAVSDRTKNVLLESAWFAPSAVRRAAKQLALHTDASHRFERGADFEAVTTALDRVAALIVEVAGGRLRTGRVDRVAPGGERQRKSITLRRTRLERVIGMSVPETAIAPLLERLGFAVEDLGDESWQIEVPLRRVDVEIEDDLVEEVLRHLGYDAVPAVLPAFAPALAVGSSVRERERAVRDALLACGLDEVVSYSFVSIADEAGLAGSQSEMAVEIDNPLAETQGILRTTLLTSLLPAAAFNHRHGRQEVFLFEVGRSFRLAPEGLRERRAAAFVMGGAWPRTFHGRAKVDLLDGKGVLESVLERLGVAGLSWSSATAASVELAPGRSAAALSGGVPVAWVGELGRRPQNHWELPGVWVVGELELGEAIAGGAGSGLAETHRLPAPPKTFAFRSFSRFPAIELDLTLEHQRTQTLAELLAAASSAPRPTALESVELADRYDGAGVPAGMVRTTLTFVYRLPERSLTLEEIRPAHDAKVAELLARLGARQS